MKYPKTRLGRLVSARSLEEILALCDEYVPGDPPEFFFDRNPENFPSVLEMYRSGKFHIPDSATCKMGPGVYDRAKIREDFAITEKAPTRLGPSPG